jgi:hypothetical protein
MESFFGGFVVFPQFIENLHHAVSPDNGIIHDKSKFGGVLEDDGVGDLALDAKPVLVEQGNATLLLVGIAQDADKNDGRVEVAGDIHIVHGDQARLGDGDFPADDLADLAFQ